MKLQPVNPDCPHCNTTAQAIEWVINKWIEAGINRGE